ncbi:MAG TPA: HigA family addiction module antitoxin [Candidatus Obscuribacterales bacterium]
MKRSSLSMHNPAHPGEVLKEHLEGQSLTDFARRIGVSRQTISAIVNCRAGITPDMDVKLEKALQTSSGFWLLMQMKHDLWLAKQRVAKIY